MSLYTQMLEILKPRTEIFNVMDIISKEYNKTSVNIIYF